MNIRKTLAVAAIAVAALSSSARAASTDFYQMAVMYTVYIQTCHVEPSTVLDDAALDKMDALKAQVPAEQRQAIFLHERAAAQKMIADIGLEPYCLFYAPTIGDFVTMLHKYPVPK